MIENAGNFVCPALFDLGEHANVAILSVIEDEDRPVKYPKMFTASDFVIINKSDLLPHLNIDIARCIENAKTVNPIAQNLQLSTTGESLDAWHTWISERQKLARKQAFAKSREM